MHKYLIKAALNIFDHQTGLPDLRVAHHSNFNDNAGKPEILVNIQRYNYRTMISRSIYLFFSSLFSSSGCGLLLPAAFEEDMVGYYELSRIRATLIEVSQAIVRQRNAVCALQVARCRFRPGRQSDLSRLWSPKRVDQTKLT